MGEDKKSGAVRMCRGASAQSPCHRGKDKPPSNLGRVAWEARFRLRLVAWETSLFVTILPTSRYTPF